MRSVTRMVRSRVVPPAPYVTETNVGWIFSIRRIASHSTASPASSRGGKNSKLMLGSGPAMARGSTA